MPPLSERDSNDVRKARPWLRDGVVRRVSPHYTEVEDSRSAMLPMLLVLVVLVSAVLFFLFIQSNGPPAPSVNVPRTTGAAPSRVPILEVPTVGASPTAVVVKYRVQSGDTLSGIAVKYGISVASLMAANSLTSNLIRPGDELIIPSSR